MGDRVVVLGPEVFGADSCVPRKVDLHQVQDCDPFPSLRFLGRQPVSDSRVGHANWGCHLLCLSDFMTIGLCYLFLFLNDFPYPDSYWIL